VCFCESREKLESGRYSSKGRCIGTYFGSKNFQQTLVLPSQIDSSRSSHAEVCEENLNTQVNTYGMNVSGAPEVFFTFITDFKGQRIRQSTRTWPLITLQPLQHLFCCFDSADTEAPIVVNMTRRTGS
jgi:hypothetical protein